MAFRHVNPPRGAARRQPIHPVPRTGCGLLLHRMRRISRNLLDQPWRASGIAFSVAVGVAIAIAIIAASNGIDTKINDLLGAHNASQTAQLRQEGINMSDIQSVLHDTRSLLTELSVVFTAALVGLVTWVTTSQRRRDIAIDRMRGLHTETVISELIGESLFLCVVGGLVGIIGGLLLCSLLGDLIPLLPLKPTPDEIATIFPITTLATFTITAIIAAIFANTASVNVG